MCAEYYVDVGISGGVLEYWMGYFCPVVCVCVCVCVLRIGTVWYLFLRAKSFVFPKKIVMLLLAIED